MPNQKNIDIVAGLKQKMQKAKSVVVTDYRTLTHKQAEELHKTVKKTGGEYLVAKNTLIKIASNDTPFQMETSELGGTTAVLFSYEDEIDSIKELAKFAKTSSVPQIKFGIIGSTRYDASQVGQIAKLPNKLTLQATVVSRLSGPIYGLMYSLNGNLQKLVYVLSAIKK